MLLAFDIGTSSVKVSVFDNDLSLRYESGARYTTRYPAPGYTEHDPKDWWDRIVTSCRELFSAHPELTPQIDAIAVSGHMLGLVPLGKDNEPLRPAMIHSDIRSLSQAQRIDSVIGKERLYRITGNILSAASPLAKALWLRDNEPEVFSKAIWFVQSKDYITSILTGMDPVTDFSDGAHAQFMDITQGAVARDVFRELSLDPSLVPPILPGTSPAGTLCPRAADILGLKSGIPVAVGGGDGACAAAGAGISRESEAYVCLGTTGWIAARSFRFVPDPLLRLADIPSLDGRSGNMTGTVQCVGRSFEWARALLGAADMGEFNEWASLAPAGSSGLVYLPYLEGERCPWYDEKARGVFFGMRPDHTPRHFARAVFEGTAFAFCDVIDCIRETLPLKELRVIGGGAASSLFLNTLASAGNISLFSVDGSASAATSLGAAQAAAVAARIFPDLSACASLIRTRPNAVYDPALADTCAPSRGTYRRLYPALKEVFSLA